MTYRCGIGPGLPGLAPCEPHVICDSCGVRLVARVTRGGAPAWLRNGLPPPGWRLVRGAGARWDYCPACKHDAPR